MPKRFDEDLYKLKQDVLAMGAVAEGMIRKSMGVLVDRNPALVAQVLADEDRMDAFQRSIDNETVRLQFFARPGETVQFQAATDLPNWEELGSSVTDPDGICRFDDTNASTFSQRFYRRVTP